MKKCTFCQIVLLILLFVGSATAQNLIIAENGRIDCNWKNGLKRDQTFYPDTSALQQWQAKAIADARMKISKNLGLALEALADTGSKDHKFYEYLWGAEYVNKQISDLNKIKAAVDDTAGGKKYHRLGASIGSPYNQLDDALANIEKKYFTTAGADDNNDLFELRVVKTDPYKQFLIDYYNTTIKNNKGIKEQSTLAKFDSLASRATKNKEKIDTQQRWLIAKLAKAPERIGLGRTGDETDNLYDWLNRSAEELNNNDQAELKSYLSNRWFSQWMWYTAGDMKTTPLGFADEANLRLHITPDTNSIRKLDSFVKAVKIKMFKDSSEKDALRYKQLVLDYNLAKETALFTDSADIKKQLTLNKKAHDNILGISSFVSDIKLPYEVSDIKNGNTYFFPYNVPEKGTIYNTQRKLPPCSVDDNITVVAYNIPKGNTVKLTKESSAPYSEISKIGGYIADGASAFAGALGQISGNAALNSLLTAVNKYRPDPKTTLPALPAPASPNAPAAIIMESWHPRSIIAFDRRYNVKNFGELSLDSLFPAITIDSTYLQPVRKKITDEHWDIIKKHIEALQKQIQLPETNTFASVKNYKPAPFDEEFFLEMKYEYEDVLVDDAETFESQMIMIYEYHLLKDLVAPQIVDAMIKESNYLQTMIRFISSASPPPTEVKANPTDAIAAFRTGVFITDYIDSATKWKYSLMYSTPIDSKKDTTTKLISFTYRTGKYYRVQSSIGLTYTLQPARQVTVTTDATTNTLSATTSAEQYGVAAAIHVYPFAQGLLLQDDHALGASRQNRLGRINFMAGLDFRKVPDNIYLGTGYNFGPGISVNIGGHLYKYTRYEIKNSQVVDKNVTYKCAWVFIYIGLEPVAFVKSLGIFK